MSKHSSRFVSGGTASLQEQPGATYPETFYGGNVPLDDKMFKEYLANNDRPGFCGPIGSGYATNTTYAQAGGATDHQLMVQCNATPCCDPVLPANQNQYSVQSHYQDLGQNTCCPMRAIPSASCLAKQKALAEVPACQAEEEEAEMQAEGEETTAEMEEAEAALAEAEAAEEQAAKCAAAAAVVGAQETNWNMIILVLLALAFFLFR